MRRISKRFALIIPALLLTSCAKESIEIPEQTNIRHFTAECADAISKTAIEDGKQVWKAGDRICVTDGINSEIVTVPGADNNKSSITFSTSTITGSTVYAVFPAEAAVNKIIDDKFYFRIPNTTDGEFSSANIMIAKSSTSSLSFRNTTSIIRFTLESADVKQISITSARESSTGNDKDILAGLFYFDYDMQRTWSAFSEDITSVTVMLNGPGTYYVPVFPVALEAGAKFVFTNSAGQTATRTTSVDNTFRVNTFKTISVDSIVDGLSFTDDWKGTGTLGDPYLITSAADFVKMTQTTSSFNKDKAFKLTADIVLPENYEPKSFYGHLDGDNHSITLTSFASGKSKVGIFDAMGTSGTYCGARNLHIKGDITINDNSLTQYGALASSCSGVVSIENCKSSVNATLSSSVLQYAGGLIGSTSGSNGCRYVNNSNSGNLSITTAKSRASRYFAGVYGFVASSSVITLTHSFNEGDITVECTDNGNYATYAAGVASSAGNGASASYCYNLGDINVRSKTTRQNCCAAGGVVNQVKCDHSYNAGAITALYGASYDQPGYAAGIAGAFQYYGNFSNDFSLEGRAPVLFGYSSNNPSDSATKCGTFTISTEGGYVSDLGMNLIDLLGSAYFMPGPAPDYYPVGRIAN